MAFLPSVVVDHRLNDDLASGDEDPNQALYPDFRWLMEFICWPCGWTTHMVLRNVEIHCTSVTCGECPRQCEWRNSEPFSDYEDEFDEGSDVDEGDGGDDDGMSGGDDDGLAALMENVMEAEGAEGANNSGLSSEAEPVVPLQRIGTKTTEAPQNRGGVILPLLVRRRLSFKQPGHLSRDARCSPQNTVSRKSRRFQIRCAP